MLQRKYSKFEAIGTLQNGKKKKERIKSTYRPVGQLHIA